MYEKRDAAFREWEANINTSVLWDRDSALSKTTVAKEAFKAGWQAHLQHMKQDNEYSNNLLSSFIPKYGKVETKTVFIYE